MSLIAERVDALQRAGRIIARRPGRFVLGVLLCAAAFSLPLFLAALAVEAAPAWRSMSVGPEVTLFLKIGTPPRDLDVLRSRLAARQGVADVRLIPRDEAYSDLRKRSGLGIGPNETRSNPLPDALVARFALTVDPAVVDRTAVTAQEWAGVDAVQTDIDWYRRLVVLRRAGMAVAAGLGVLTAALVAFGFLAGAQATIQVSRDESELLRLVGARPTYVRRPYAYVGALSAAGGAALAVAMSALACIAVRPHWAAAVSALELPAGGLKLPIELAPAFVLAAGVLGGLVGAIAARSQTRDF